MPESGRRPLQIVIIGGGFSGATVALNLLQKPPSVPAAITVIEPRPLLGGGVAYSSIDPAHRLNVPASRMLVLCEAPGAFEDWFKSSGALAADPDAQLPDGRIYPRRAIFGQYIDLTLRAAAAAGAMPFRHARTTAVAAAANGQGFRITTRSSEVVEADILVLAASHPPPAVPKPLRDIAGEAKFIANPWLADALRGIGAGDRVLIIGTALSTADVVASLQAQGHRGGILAVSRRGLVSRLRAMAQAENFGDFTTKPSTTAAGLLRRTRATIAEAQAAGSSWGAVIDAMRVQGLAIWSALPTDEKKRLLRHLRTFWDVHRYQVAPQLAAISDSLCKAGRLRFCAARIEAAKAEAGRLRLRLKFRGQEPAWEDFDAVVNCTGPDHGGVIRENKALSSLNAAGLLLADDLRLGIATDLTARALDASGRPHPHLFVAGPLARAAFGELMGLPQVSQHAALVAAEVTRAIESQKGKPFFL